MQTTKSKDASSHRIRARTGGKTLLKDRSLLSYRALAEQNIGLDDTKEDIGDAREHWLSTCDQCL